MVQIAEKSGFVEYVYSKEKPTGRASVPGKVYDRKFKTFVMHKEVFAFAAARLVRQFKGVPYQELVGLVQRNDRERDTARLDTLAGFSTDGRLRAQMNIEGQNLSSSYRKIRTRMLRYPCRLVADQKERQVPTVSLWLCFGFPRKYQGKEASYVLEDVPLGVGLGGFFAVLLSSELATRQKVEMLRAWRFTMTEQMQKKDRDMHSWEGFGAALTQKGVLMGRKEGKQEASVLHVRNLAAKQGISYDEAMDILDIPKTSREGIHKQLTRNRKGQPGTDTPTV